MLTLNYAMNQPFFSGLVRGGEVHYTGTKHKNGDAKLPTVTAFD